ncbi:MAG: hypothetical protein EOO01_42275 [Chitinophagaceae bacterium]|nr:MAG: hypothetical protein EOO01_42275 [Chitinophagaceae bacterium]
MRYRHVSNRVKSGGWDRSLLFLVVLIFISGLLQAQQRRDWKTRIDQIVEKADSLSLQSQIMFYSERILKNKEVIKETWHYTMENDRVIIFQVRYLLNGSEITEVYYVDRNELICMERIEAPNAAVYMDEIRRGELYFLENRALRQYVSYGKKPSSQTYGNAQYDCLTTFENRYAELRRNMEIVNATRRKW